MDQVARLRAADDLIRRLAAALRAAQLYAPSHPLVQRAFDGLDESLTQILNEQPTIAIGLIPVILWFTRHGTIYPPDWRVKAFCYALVFACLLIPIGRASCRERV